MRASHSINLVSMLLVTINSKRINIIGMYGDRTEPIIK